MARLRWGVKTAPQHTTYDAMLAGLAGGRPDARLRARVALRPFRTDPGRPGWSLLGGVDAAGGPGGPDLAPAPRVDGRGQHLPPPRGPCPHGGHGRRHLQRSPRLRCRRRLERVRAPEHGDPALRRPASASGASARPARSPGGCGRSTSPTSTGATTSSRRRAASRSRSRSRIRRSSSAAVASSSPCASWRATPTSGTSRGADVEDFRHKVRVLHEHCAAIGRDPAQIELSVQARVNYDDLAATVGDAPAARRRRRHPPRPDADLSLSRRHRRPAGRRGSGPGRVTGVVLYRLLGSHRLTERRSTTAVPCRACSAVGT